MSLDPIWKQQLALVSYGNEYLQQHIALEQLRTHSIFYQQQCYFRDLKQQHLLAQHVTVWLEGLKRTGCTRLSLHHSELLNAHANPNANVELLAYSHFIVSHHGEQRFAWMCGNELAEWYPYDQPFDVPLSQQSPLHDTTYWRYALPKELNKAIESDLKAPNWAEIQQFLDERLFQHPLAQGLALPMAGTPYMGMPKETYLDAEGHWQPDVHYLPLISDRYIADLAHQFLYQFDALDKQLNAEQQLQQDDPTLSDERRYALRNFRQTFEDLRIRCITKIANHYPSANSSQWVKETPSASQQHVTSNTNTSTSQHVLGLIVLVVALCFLGYYFGL